MLSFLWRTLESKVLAWFLRYFIWFPQFPMPLSYPCHSFCTSRFSLFLHRNFILLYFWLVWNWGMITLLCRALFPRITHQEVFLPPTDLTHAHFGPGCSVCWETSCPDVSMAQSLITFKSLDQYYLLLPTGFTLLSPLPCLFSFFPPSKMLHNLLLFFFLMLIARK